MPVSLDGMCNEYFVILESEFVSFPVKPTVNMPILLAVSTAFNTDLLSPLVEMAISISLSLPIPNNCLENISL